MSDTFSGGDIAAAVSSSTPSSSASPAGGASETTSTGTAPITPVASDAGTSEPSVATAGTPAVASADTTTAGETTAGAGEPPKERWPDILKNAREKAAAEVEANFAWARDIDRGELEHARAWMQLADRDPVMAVDRIMQTVLADPQHAPALRSYLGRMLSAGRQSRAAAQPNGGDEMPGPDIPTSESNGQPVVYSAQRTRELLQWQQKQLLAQVDQKVAPYEQDRKARQAATEKEQVDRHVADYTQRTLGSLKAQPGFEENKAEIAKVYAAIPINDPRTEGEKLRDAYLTVVGSRMNTVGRQQAIADINRKSSANTVSPSANSPAAPFDYKKATVEEALRHEWEQRARK